MMYRLDVYCEVVYHQNAMIKILIFTNICLFLNYHKFFFVSLRWC